MAVTLNPDTGEYEEDSGTLGGGTSLSGTRMKIGSGMALPNFSDSGQIQGSLDLPADWSISNGQYLDAFGNPQGKAFQSYTDAYLDTLKKTLFSNIKYQDPSTSYPEGSLNSFSGNYGESITNPGGYYLDVPSLKFGPINDTTSGNGWGSSGTPEVFNQFGSYGEIPEGGNFMGGGPAFSGTLYDSKASLESYISDLMGKGAFTPQYRNYQGDASSPDIIIANALAQLKNDGTIYNQASWRDAGNDNNLDTLVGTYGLQGVFDNGKLVGYRGSVPTPWNEVDEHGNKKSWAYLSPTGMDNWKGMVGQGGTNYFVPLNNIDDFSGNKLGIKDFQKAVEPESNGPFGGGFGGFMSALGMASGLSGLFGGPTLMSLAGDVFGSLGSIGELAGTAASGGEFINGLDLPVNFSFDPTEMINGLDLPAASGLESLFNTSGFSGADFVNNAFQNLGQGMPSIPSENWSNIDVSNALSTPEIMGPPMPQDVEGLFLDDYGGGTNAKGEFTDRFGRPSRVSQLSELGRNLGLTRETAAKGAEMANWLTSPTNGVKGAPSPLNMGVKLGGALDSWYKNKQAMGDYKSWLNQLENYQDPNYQRGQEANKMWLQTQKDPMYGYNDFMAGPAQQWQKQAMSKAAQSGNRGNYINSGAYNSDLASLWNTWRGNRAQSLAGGFSNGKTGTELAAQYMPDYLKMKRNANSPLWDAAGNIMQSFDNADRFDEAMKYLNPVMRGLSSLWG